VIVSTVSDAPPTCPAAPDATIQFCRDRWRHGVDGRRWAATLGRRERVVRSLRAAGDARAADAAGWLSLAGMLTALAARVVGSVLADADPAALVDRVAALTTGGYGALCAQPDGPPRRHVTVDGLEVVDAGSRSGWAIADMAGRAAVGDVVIVAGHPLTPSAFRDVLRERVASALDAGGQRP